MTRGIAFDGVPETVFELPQKMPQLVTPRFAQPLVAASETVVYVCGYDADGEQLFENPVSCTTTADGIYATVDSITLEIEQDTVLGSLRYKVPMLGDRIIDSTWHQPGGAHLSVGYTLTLQFDEPGRRLVSFL